MHITDPGLFTTLIYSKEQQKELKDKVIDHLSRPQNEGGLALIPHPKRDNEWRNTAQETLVIYFTPPEAPDVHVIQISINPKQIASEDALKAWGIAREKIQLAIKNSPIPPMGRSLIYQAILRGEVNVQAIDSVIKELLAKGQLYASDGQPFTQPLGISKVPGGYLGLLSTANNEEKDTVYIALGPPSEQKVLNLEILFGKEAALIWPDITAHKAYYMSHIYFTKIRSRYLNSTSSLMNNAANFLNQDGIPNLQNLTNTSNQVARLATVSAEMYKLCNDMDIHHQNYLRSLNKNELGGAVFDYHLSNIEKDQIRIDHDREDARASMEAANTVINILRAQYDQERITIEKQRAIQEKEIEKVHQAEREEQEEREKQRDTLLAILGILLGIIVGIPDWLNTDIIQIFIINILQFCVSNSKSKPFTLSNESKLMIAFLVQTLIVGTILTWVVKKIGWSKISRYWKELTNENYKISDAKGATKSNTVTTEVKHSQSPRPITKSEK